MSSGGGGWTRFGNKRGQAIQGSIYIIGGDPYANNDANDLSAFKISKKKEKIKTIARQYVYAIHKKLGGAFSKGTIECP